MGESPPLDSIGSAQNPRNDLPVHDHLRIPLALTPAAQCFLVRGVCGGIGLKQCDELRCREFVTLDPAQHIVDCWAEESDDRVDAIWSIERRLRSGTSAGQRLIHLVCATSSIDSWDRDDSVAAPVRLTLLEPGAVGNTAAAESPEELTTC